MTTAYVTVQDAQTFFDDKLHETAWTLASATDRTKSLVAATRIIDQLNFKGDKNSVCALITANTDGTSSSISSYRAANQEAIRAANVAQENEFPRGKDTAVPEKIKWSTYEIAYALLDGVDPDIEMENIPVQLHGIGSVQTAYNRNQEPLEHILNGIPSATAWKYLKPFLRDDDHIRLSRVS